MPELSHSFLPQMVPLLPILSTPDRPLLARLLGPPPRFRNRLLGPVSEVPERLILFRPAPSYAPRHPLGAAQARCSCASLRQVYFDGRYKVCYCASLDASDVKDIVCDDGTEFSQDAGILEIFRILPAQFECALGRPCWMSAQGPRLLATDRALVDFGGPEICGTVGLREDRCAGRGRKKRRRDAGGQAGWGAEEAAGACLCPQASCGRRRGMESARKSAPAPRETKMGCCHATHGRLGGRAPA